MKILIIAVLLVALFPQLSLADAWIKLERRDVPDNIETGRDWRIKDNWFEVSNKTVDALAFDSLEELMNEAHKNNLPFFLVRVKTGKPGEKKYIRFIL